MLQNDVVVRVRNLTDQTIAYVIPELKVRRVFRDFETKEITAHELRQLWYMPGGARLLQDFLAVENKELAEEFGVSEDSFLHEYSWTLEDIKRVLLKGSIDELADALDFAPLGIIDTLVSQAIALELADMNKDRLIQEKTGHNISKMIQYHEELEKINENKTILENSGRRVRRVDNNKKSENVGRRV